MDNFDSYEIKLLNDLVMTKQKIIDNQKKIIDNDRTIIEKQKEIINLYEEAFRKIKERLGIPIETEKEAG